MDDQENGVHAGSVAFNETPKPVSVTIGPTQVVDPEFGQYNKPGIVLNLVETHIVEL